MSSPSSSFIDLINISFVDKLDKFRFSIVDLSNIIFIDFGYICSSPLNDPTIAEDSLSGDDTANGTVILLSSTISAWVTPVMIISIIIILMRTNN